MKALPSQKGFLDPYTQKYNHYNIVIIPRWCYFRKAMFFFRDSTKRSRSDVQGIASIRMVTGAIPPYGLPNSTRS